VIYDILIKNAPNSYETGDVIDIHPAGHIFRPGELDLQVFTIIKNVELSATDKLLLKIADAQLVIPKSVLPVPALRRKLLNRDNIKYIKRRRYRVTNNITERK